MTREQGEKRGCAAGEVPEGAKGPQQFVLECLIYFKGGNGVGKSVFGLGRKACEGSASQTSLMAKRELLAGFFFSFTFK